MTDTWHLLVPLLLGAAAIYLLLPRPRPHPVWWGAGLGTLALVLAGMLIVRSDVIGIEQILFYAFSAIAIISGSMLIVVQNPARAAISFTLVVTSTCGLFLMLAAPFLAAATVIVYAGAIVVTFLFVIMLAQQAGFSDADARSREPLLASLTGFILLGGILFVLDKSHGTADLDALVEETRAAMNETPADNVVDRVEGSKLFERYDLVLKERGLPELRNTAFMLQITAWAGAKTTGEGRLEKLQDALKKLESVGTEAQQVARSRAGLVYLPDTKEGPRKISNLSGPPPETGPTNLRRDEARRPHLPAENSSHLGKSLFTDYLLPVELAGILLLVAIVGAIAISHRHEPEAQP